MGTDHIFSQADGELWDLERPLEKSCKLELLDFEHPEGSSGCPIAVQVSDDYFRSQERRFSGTPQPMFSAKLQNGIMDVICVSGPLQTTDSSMRWE